MKRMVICVILVLSFFLMENTTTPRELGDPLALLDRPEYVPGEILVKYKHWAAASAINSLQNQLGMTTIKSITFINARHIKLPTDMSVESALATLRQNPNVEYAEPNYIYYTFTISKLRCPMTPILQTFGG